MSKDVAKIIWELAKKDYSPQNLKEMYKSKLIQEKLELMCQLKEAIQNHIMTERQVVCPFLDVTSMVKPLNIDIQHKYSNIKNKERQYSYPRDDVTGSWVTVKNKEAQALIDYAIVPLDLKWSVTSSYPYGMIVSWDHWQVNEDAEKKDAEKEMCIDVCK